eukprot:1965792-Rhodomonas_salina.1
MSVPDIACAAHHRYWADGNMHSVSAGNGTAEREEENKDLAGERRARDETVQLRDAGKAPWLVSHVASHDGETGRHLSEAWSRALLRACLTRLVGLRLILRKRKKGGRQGDRWRRERGREREGGRKIGGEGARQQARMTCNIPSTRYWLCRIWCVVARPRAPNPLSLVNSTKEGYAAGRRRK